MERATRLQKGYSATLDTRTFLRGLQTIIDTKGEVKVSVVGVAARRLMSFTTSEQKIQLFEKIDALPEDAAQLARTILVMAMPKNGRR